MIDFEKLEANLDKMKGYDFLEVEHEERLTGNTTIELSTSKSFQARLAARALGMNVNDIKDLNIREFYQVCVRVFGFLNERGLLTT